MRTLKPCGTVAAYQRHIKNGEPTCDACRQANAEYHRGYMARASEASEKAAAYQRAYNRAQAELARRHRDEFRALLAASLEEAA